MSETWRERNAVVFRPRNTPTFETQVEELRYYLDRKLITKSFDIYQKITQRDPSALEIMDHLKVMDLYRTGRTEENNRRLVYIFNQIEKSGFPVAPAVYELMVSRVGRFSPVDAKHYFDKFVATHGASAVSLNAYGSLILAHFRNGKKEEAKKMAEDAKSVFADLHDLKPILMELELELGNEAGGLKHFKEYIRNETGYLKIAKAYGWLSNWYAVHDRLDDAVCVIEDLSKRGINLNQASFNVLCKIALMRGQLAEAKEFLNRAMEMVNVDRFGTLPTDLIQAFLKKDDFQGAMNALRMYRSHASHIRELRYRPYYEVMAYLAQNGKKAEDAHLIFNLIPHASRFRNALAVRIMLDVYLYCGETQAAHNFYKTAVRLGFDPAHAEVNEQYIRQGYQEGSLNRLVMNNGPRSDSLHSQEEEEVTMNS